MALNNVNLMGPQVGQPIDLQTQQAQLAIAQKRSEERRVGKECRL